MNYLFVETKTKNKAYFVLEIILYINGFQYPIIFHETFFFEHSPRNKKN